MTTLYVSSSGSDDYTVDGTADNVQINQALAYANSHGTASNPITIYLRSHTYELDSWLLAGNNTILTGDSTAKLKLKNNAGWSNINTSSNPQTHPLIDQISTSIKNFTVHGFEIDGNCGDLTGTGLYYSTNQPGYVRGKLNYIVMFFKYGTNITMHDMYVHDCLSDCMRMDHGNGLYYYNNNVQRMGHDGSYFIRSQNFEVYGNNTRIRTNSAHRIWNTGYGSIHDNTMQPDQLTGIYGNPGIQLEDSTGATREVEVYSNTLTNCWGEGMWIIEYGTGYTVKKNLYVHDNILSGCARINSIDYNAGISINGWDGARFEGNHITGCYNAGFLVNGSPSSGKSTLYFTGNTVSGTLETLNSRKDAWTGYGVANTDSDSTSVIATGNSVSGNANGNYYKVTPSVTQELKIAAKLKLSSAIDFNSNTKAHVTINGDLVLSSDFLSKNGLRDHLNIDAPLMVSSAFECLDGSHDIIDLQSGMVLGSDVELVRGPTGKITKDAKIVLSGSVIISDNKIGSGNLKTGDTVLLTPLPGGDYTLIKLIENN